MDNAYGVQITMTMEQAVNIFQRPRPKTRTWNENCIELVEVNHADGGIPKLVFESVVEYASPAYIASANMAIDDWLLQAETPANFAQAMSLDERPNNWAVKSTQGMMHQ